MNRTTRAGYVFSSRHADDAMMMAEVQHRFGYHVQPRRELSFDQGYFETAWVNNVVALGTASGFVEPLGAALAAYTFEQLRNLERILASGGESCSLMRSKPSTAQTYDPGRASAITSGCTIMVAEMIRRSGEN
ncbi:hypothetical protein EKH55_5978 (plasmid) [Sinorhizobium alkalisoli]|nr:hypothetical protein EKH55_5978 [Sinorhizobium alkalisoli]